LSPYFRLQQGWPVRLYRYRPTIQPVDINNDSNTANTDGFVFPSVRDPKAKQKRRLSEENHPDRVLMDGTFISKQRRT
jgi:hypothetical protein